MKKMSQVLFVINVDLWNVINLFGARVLHFFVLSLRKREALDRKLFCFRCGFFLSSNVY